MDDNISKRDINDYFAKSNTTTKNILKALMDFPFSKESNKIYFEAIKVLVGIIAFFD